MSDTEEETLDYDPQEEEEGAEHPAVLKQSVSTLVPKLAAFGFDWESSKWHLLNTTLFMLSIVMSRMVPGDPIDDEEALAMYTGQL